MDELDERTCPECEQKQMKELDSKFRINLDVSSERGSSHFSSSLSVIGIESSVCVTVSRGTLLAAVTEMATDSIKPD